MKSPRPNRPSWKTPFDAATGRFLAVGHPGQVAPFTIVEAGNDALLCTDYAGRYELVRRPWSLRKSAFDGQTINGVAYVSTALDTRTADGTTETVTPYAADEVILAARLAQAEDLAVDNNEFVDLPGGTYAVEWEDLNTAGRRFEASSAAYQLFRLKQTLADCLKCVTLSYDEAGTPTEGSDYIYVAKPKHLRVSYYDTFNFNGLDYASTSSAGQSREVTDVGDTRTYYLSPAYIDTSYLGGDITVEDEILAAVLTSPVGIDDPNGDPIYYLDLNVDARRFKAAEPGTPTVDYDTVTGQIGL